MTEHDDLIEDAKNGRWPDAEDEECFQRYDGSFVCTRPPHLGDGPHVARDDAGRVCCVWWDGEEDSEYRLRTSGDQTHPGAIDPPAGSYGATVFFDFGRGEVAFRDQNGVIATLHQGDRLELSHKGAAIGRLEFVSAGSEGSEPVEEPEKPTEANAEASGLSFAERRTEVGGVWIGRAEFMALLVATDVCYQESVDVEACFPFLERVAPLFGIEDLNDWGAAQPDKHPLIPVREAAKRVLDRVRELAADYGVAESDNFSMSIVESHIEEELDLICNAVEWRDEKGAIGDLAVSPAEQELIDRFMTAASSEERNTALADLFELSTGVRPTVVDNLQESDEDA